MFKGSRVRPKRCASETADARRGFGTKCAKHGELGVAPIDRGEAFRTSGERKSDSARGTRPSLAPRARRPAPVPSTGRRSQDQAAGRVRPSRLGPREPLSPRKILERQSVRGTRPSLAPRARRPAPVPSTGRRSRDRATLSRPSRLRPRRASESMKKSWIVRVKKMVPSTTFFFWKRGSLRQSHGRRRSGGWARYRNPPVREIPRGHAGPGSRPPRGVRPPVWDSGLRARALPNGFRVLPPSELKPSSSAVPACRVGQSQPSEETTVEARCGFREPPVPRANAR